MNKSSGIILNLFELGYIIFTIITYKILAYFKFFDQNEKFIISLAFLCSITIVPTIYFAERDHFIAIVLLPFILIQLCITYKYHIKSKILKYFILITGAIALLLKPHFGLIAAFIFLHRMVTRKQILQVAKDADFIIMSTITTGYLLIIWVFFQDFITIILPDVLQYYLNYTNLQNTLFYVKIYGFISFVFLLLSLVIFHNDKHKIISSLSICTILALAAFALQAKGFGYHILPFHSLLFPLGFLIIYNIIKPKRYIKIMLLVIIFGVSYAKSPLMPNYATHKHYENNKITDYINANCAKPCSYFMTYENMDIVSQLAFYSQHTYATRFPAFWFMPMLSKKIENSTSQNDKEKAMLDKLRFSDYIAEDIKNMAPSLIFILQPKNKDHVGFIQNFSVSKNFSDVISKYKKTESITIDRAYFYKDTRYDFEYFLTWDVYKKNE